MPTTPIVYQRMLVCMKISDQIIDVLPGGHCTADITDMTAIEPIRQFRQAAETGTRTTLPELLLGAFEIANSVGTKVGVRRGRTDAPGRLQGVLKAHGDVPPVEDDSRVGHDLSLHLPQPRIAIREHRHRGAATDAGTHNRLSEFARGIAVAGKSEAMLRSIDVEDFAGDRVERKLINSPCS